MESTPDQRLPDTRSDLTLAAAMQVMEPLVKLLLQEGITYPGFSNAIKTVFLQVAPSVLADNSAKVNDSSISMLTGVHRKDVREWRSVGRLRPQAKEFSAAMEAFTRWSNDPEYCDMQGHPRTLDRTGGVGSFEALATAISKDVHARTLLQELLRLGIAQRTGSKAGETEDQIRLCVDAFVPKKDSVGMLKLLAANVGDHLATAVHNVSGNAHPLLEQSVYADGLSRQSVEVMHTLARQVWANAFQQIVGQATLLSDQDAGQPDADQRVRLGMYFSRDSNSTP
jgi:hypothetical protein